MQTASSLLVGLALPLFLTLAAPGVQPGRDANAAHRAIAKVLEAQQAAWNKGDLDGFMQGYWQSDRLSFFSEATRTSGWRATLDRYRKRYQGEDREMGKLAFQEVETELLAPDSALVRGRWQLRMRSKTVGGLFTLIFRKLPEGWRIVHDHTSAAP
jgi:beta-aspartyl-peptidase (threonine type)